MFPLLALTVVLVMAPLSLHAQTGTLGTNFSVSGNWPSTWANNFDATSIAGVFSPGDGLGVGFYSTGSAGDAILEKHFGRGSQDSNAYNVTLSETGEGYISLNETHYVAYSVNQGATWVQLGSEVMSSDYTEGTISGTITVTGSQTLWVRYGVVDNLDGSRHQWPRQLHRLRVREFRREHRVVSWHKLRHGQLSTGWQSNFYSASIDGVWNNLKQVNPGTSSAVTYSLGANFNGLPSSLPSGDGAARKALRQSHGRHQYLRCPPAAGRRWLE